MSWNVRISRQAQEDLDNFRAHHPDLYRQSYRLTKAVQDDPFDGAGVPRKAPILGQNVWYRNVSLEHRMVYEVFDSDVVVASYRIHFD